MFCNNNLCYLEPVHERAISYIHIDTHDQVDEGPLCLKILQISLRDQAILEEARVDGNVREAHENVLGQLRSEVMFEIAILDSYVVCVHNIDSVSICQV